MFRRCAPPLLGVSALFVAAFVGWVCPFRFVFGLPCPSCGLSRALRLVLHGRWAEAMALHPLVPIVVPLVGLALAIELWGYLRAEVWGTSRKVPFLHGAMVVAAALMFALWLARFGGAFGGPVPPT